MENFEFLRLSDTVFGSRANSGRSGVRRAIESGQAVIAAHAAFRRGWVALMDDRFSEAERYADQAVALAGANSRTMEDLREFLRVRIAVRKGDAGAVDLLADPVAAIGHPAATATFRASQWAPGILRQVRDRRYVPLDVEPGDPGFYRIDRFTVRAGMGVPTGTRIQQRTGNLTIHVIDLTETKAMSDAQRRQSEDGSKSATEAGETARTSGQGGELANEDDR